MSTLASRTKKGKPEKSASYETAGEITATQYKTFQAAFDHLNKALFAGGLPQPLITLQRHGGMNGHFAGKKFVGRRNGESTDEIALNPDNFTGRTDEDICGTLTHEMVHGWQKAFGHPPRGNYHDKEWAAKMKEIGLYPSSTGQVGGKEAGGRVSHYIIKDGPFAKAYAELAKTGFKLDWQSKPPEPKQRQSKTKFSCPTCGQNTWAKPDAQLICGICNVGPLMLSATGGQP
jgi:hypothetical protein